MQSVGLTPTIADAINEIAKDKGISLEEVVNDMLRNYVGIYYQAKRIALVEAKEAFDNSLKAFKL